MNYTTQFTFFKMIKNATIAPSLIGSSVWGHHTTSTYNHNLLREANFWLIIQILIKIIGICLIFIYNPENFFRFLRYRSLSELFSKSEALIATLSVCLSVSLSAFNNQLSHTSSSAVR